MRNSLSVAPSVTTFQSTELEPHNLTTFQSTELEPHNRSPTSVDSRRKTLKGRLIAPHVHGDFRSTYCGLVMYGPISKFKNVEFEKDYHNVTNKRFKHLLVLSGSYGAVLNTVVSIAIFVEIYVTLSQMYYAYLWSVVAFAAISYAVTAAHLLAFFDDWWLISRSREVYLYVTMSVGVAAAYALAVVTATDPAVAAAPADDKVSMVCTTMFTALLYFNIETCTTAALFPSRSKYLVFFLAFLAGGMTIVLGLGFLALHSVIPYNDVILSGVELMVSVNIWIWALLFFGSRCVNELKDRIDFFQYTSARANVEKMSIMMQEETANKTGGSAAVEEILNWLIQIIKIIDNVDTEIDTPVLKNASLLLHETVSKLSNADQLFRVNVDNMLIGDPQAIQVVNYFCDWQTQSDGVSGELSYYSGLSSHSDSLMSVPLRNMPSCSLRNLPSGSLRNPPLRGHKSRRTMTHVPIGQVKDILPLRKLPTCVLGKELNGVVGRGWNLNLLELAEGNSNILVEVGTALVAEAAKTFGVEIEVFQRLFYEIQKRYFANPYHNATHGATVAHTSMSLCRMLKVDTGLSYGTADEVTFAIAALAHDIGHPGRNNAYLVNCIHPLAVLYNDTAVLENFHCALLFCLLSAPGTDVYQYFDANVFQRVRSRIVELVLATDMKQHFESQTKFRVRRASPEFDYDKRVEDMWLVLKMCLIAADISHGALEWSQHVEWSMRVTEEFYRQGDSELSMGLPKSPLCDRDTHKGLAKSQKGFLDFVVYPLYVELDAAANGALQSTCLIRLVENKSRWDERAVLEVVTPIPEAITALSTSTPNVKKLIKELTGAVTYQQSLPAKRSAEEKLTCVKETQTDISDESEGDVELQKGLSDALCKVDSE